MQLDFEDRKGMLHRRSSKVAAADVPGRDGSLATPRGDAPSSRPASITADGGASLPRRRAPLFRHSSTLKAALMPLQSIAVPCSSRGEGVAALKHAQVS